MVNENGIPVDVQCAVCAGAGLGRYYGEYRPCSTCGGTGWVTVQARLTDEALDRLATAITKRMNTRVNRAVRSPR